MKTFKDLRPGDYLIYNGDKYKISEVTIRNTVVYFELDRRHYWGGSNRFSITLPLKDFEKEYSVETRSVIIASDDSKVIEKAKAQKKILEIEAVIREIGYLKQKLDRICT